MAIAAEMTTKGEEIAVSDTTLAAWLKTQGHCPVRITPGQGPRKAFVFRDVPPELIQAFALDTARVSPVQFGLAYKSLIRLLNQTL